MTDQPDDQTDDAGGATDYVFSDQIGYLLRRAYQRHLAIFQAHASDPQLTSVQFSTLCALRDRGPQSQGELVRATNVDQATIRGIISRLKARDLITLSVDPKDARKVINALTPAGAALLDSMVPRARQISEMTLKNLNAVERTALIYTLRSMLDSDD